MKALRFWVVTLLVWFFLLYNIERLLAPINLASFVYVLIVVLSALIILFPQFQRKSLFWLFTASILLFFGLKVWLGYEIGGAYLPLTVTEVCIIAVTVGLAWQVSQCLEEFRQAVTDVLIGHLKSLSQSFDSGQREMYREVRRARTHQRPLALLAIAASEEALDFSIERFIEEVSHEMIRKYIVARLAEFLSREMRDYDIITQRENHFITLLPETNPEEIAKIVRKLSSLAKEKLGLSLKIGISTFPEEVTFEKLVEFAEANMQGTAVANNGHIESIPERVGESFSSQETVVNR